MEDHVEKIVEQIPLKEAYEDTVKPFAKETSNLLSLIPRTIHATLLPLEQWILKREYAVKETEALLNKKLKYCEPNRIHSPEPSIAIPAIEAISYSKNCQQIREMYANLLAKSMIDGESDFVHPAFVEIIKQLTPDEAKIINYLLLYGDRQPVLEVRRLTNTKVKERGSHIVITNFNYKTLIAWLDSKSNIVLLNPKILSFSNDLGHTFLRNVSNISYYSNCNLPTKIESYIDNLSRLKIIDVVYSSYLDTPDEYTSIALSNHMKNILLDDFNKHDKDEGITYQLTKGFICFSDFGKEFVKVCVDKDDADDMINDKKYSISSNT